MRSLGPQMWTIPQRKVLGVLLLLLCLILSIRLWRNNQIVPALLPDEGPRANELMSQLDLNSANAAQLSAIPRLGEVKARAIVAYREQFIAEHPGQQAFEKMEDLFRIKGIGPSTTDLLRQYTFISATAATRPR